MKPIYNDRLNLVESAKQGDIKSAAWLVSTRIPIVRKWLRASSSAILPSSCLRFGAQQGVQGLFKISADTKCSMISRYRLQAQRLDLPAIHYSPAR